MGVLIRRRDILLAGCAIASPPHKYFPAPVLTAVDDISLSKDSGKVEYQGWFGY
jgi:hypothetical protein